MLCLSGFELYSRWVPLSYEELAAVFESIRNGEIFGMNNNAS